MPDRHAPMPTSIPAATRVELQTEAKGAIADKVFPAYSKIATVQDLPEYTLDRIRHFFEHYKDLEKGKWVKVEGWEGPDAARAEIMASIESYQAAPDKPHF